MMMPLDLEVEDKDVVEFVVAGKKIECILQFHLEVVELAIEDDDDDGADSIVVVADVVVMGVVLVVVRSADLFELLQA